MHCGRNILSPMMWRREYRLENVDAGVVN